MDYHKVTNPFYGKEKNISFSYFSSKSVLLLLTFHGSLFGELKIQAATNIFIPALRKFYHSGPYLYNSYIYLVLLVFSAGTFYKFLGFTKFNKFCSCQRVYFLESLI